MPDASYLQTSFLGGEWSPLIQGRMDDPRYRTGMNVCRNGLPIEEGSWVRRPGQRLVGPTRKGAVAVLREFHFAESHSYNLELSAGHLRFTAGAGIVTESFGTRTIIALNTGNPVQLTTDAAHGWATGDQVIVQIGTGELNATIAALLGRQLEATVVSSTTLTVTDSVTGAAINGTSMALGSTDLTVTRIADFVTPYAESDLQAINTVQDQSDLLLLQRSYPPFAVQSSTPEDGQDFAVFSLGAAVFKDGPYLDPPTDGTTATTSGLSGSVTLTLAGGSTRFAATDVGRMVRLFSEPAAWAIGTAYAVGDQVKFDSAYYQALKTNTGKQPDADVVNWAISVSAAQWTWGTITAFTDTTHATITLQNPILRTTACATWRLGLFSATTGYPSCGTYHEGRLWLAGVIGNRMDGSKSNDPFNFEPTAPDGTVADDNACAYVFNAKDVNQIFWMEPDTLGIVCGTQAGEWLVQASAQNDNLTPTSVQAHRRTVYGCADVPPKRTGITITFVQRLNKKVLEYITTDFRGLSAHTLSITGKHLTQKGVVELAYQREKVPTIWARTEDGQLLSCTYRREQPYASEPPDFSGWARHDMHGLTVESIQAGPNFDGTIDALSLVASDANGKRWMLLETDLFDVDWTIGDAMYVDFAESPSMWEVITGPPKLLRLYSLHYLAGKIVDVFAGGIDAGTLTVAADGHLDIPIDSTTLPLLTSSWLASLTTSTNFHGLGLGIVVTPTGTANAPTITGIQNFDTSALSSTFRNNTGADIDFDGRRLFMPETTGGFQVLSLDTYKLLAGPFTTPEAGNGLIYAEDGFVYGTAGGGSNVATLSRISPDTGAVMASFGQHAGGFVFASSTTTWAIPRSIDTLKVNNTTYMVSAAMNSSQTSNEVCVLNLGATTLMPIRFAGAFSMNEAIGVVTKGLPIRGLGQAHVLSWGETQTTANSLILGLYTVAITGGVASMRKVAAIAPNALAPGWTHISGIAGVILDETDGNILAHVSEAGLPAYNAGNSYSIGALVSNAGHDFKSLQNTNLGNTPTVGGTAFWADLGVSGTVENRLVKINVRTGAIIWSLGLSAGPTSDHANSSRIRFGRYNWLDFNSPHSNHHSIVTATGTDTVSANLSFTTGAQITDDKTGNVYFNASYFGTPPAQIGTTPSSFNDWATLGPAAGPASPAALPPSDGVFWTTPVAIGFTYMSQGQILRAINPQEAGARDGPALAKTRRSHMFGALLFKTQGISFGTDFSFLRPALVHDTNDETVLPLTTLYSDVHWDTLDDTYSFNSMLCWQITRPYPANVCSLGAFLHTQDR